MSSPSVLDLSFIRGSLLTRETNWRTIPTGSDHLAISLDLIQPHPLPVPQERQAFNTTKANWSLFASYLQGWAQKFNTYGFSSPEQLDYVAETFSNAILLAAQAAIPKRKVTQYSKPWYSPELTGLRRAMNRASSALRHSPSVEEVEIWRKARNTYFTSVKTAKKRHWNSFLENADSQTIFKALAYTKQTNRSLIPTIQGEDSFEGKCQALRQALFPNPPPALPLPNRWASYIVNPAWSWGTLDPDELALACSQT